jgi:RimJ/RimL family protein N-acetyltransferase
MEVNRTWIMQPVMLVMQEVWEFLIDDSDLEFKDYRPRMSDDSRWYVISLDGQVAAVFWMRRVNAVTWEAHANVRPKFWGQKKGTQMCRAAIDKMIEDTGAKKVIALIPDSSKPVQRMAEAIGFKREGRQTKSFQKNGKLYDQIHYGITRN